MKRFNFFKYTTLGNKVDTTYFDYWYFKKLVAGGTPAPTEPVEGEGTEFTLSTTSNKKLAVVSLKGDTSQNTLSGKNLFNLNETKTESNATSTISGNSITVTSNSNASTARVSIPVNYEVGQQVTISFKATCLQYDVESDTPIIVYMRTGGNTTTQIRLDKTIGVTQEYTSKDILNYEGMSLWLYIKTQNVSGTISCRFDDIQIEAGSTATTYEPYCGGVPSPNPDYPQDVNVVTGTQTLTITNGEDIQTYPITLGSVELCKIGTYQDYIYKSSDKWYVHNETAKNVYVGATGEDWIKTTSGGLTLYFISEELARKGSSSPMKTNMFIWSSVSNKVNYIYTNSQGAFVVINPSSNGVLVANDVASYKSWLSTHNLIVYYSLTTPTDTEITDATLLADLNTLLSSGYLKKGTNTIKTTSTGTNLPTIIYIKSS